MDIFDISSPHFYIYLALSLINAGMMCFASLKFLQIIQLSGYRLKGYIEWLKDTRARYISRCAMLSFLSISSMIVVNSFIDFYATHKLYSYLGLIVYFALTFIYIKNIYEAPKKTPLKQTHRINRLITLLFFLTVAVTYGILALFSWFENIIRFAMIGITPVLMPLLVPLAHAIMIPFEELNKKRYVSKAKKELKKHPNLIKIGITGSYGKTSTKYILNKILSKKYKVCMSPNSFNTPMGLTKVVLKYLKEDDEVLIAEMGAKQRNEIKELCNLINPQHAIITAIGPQHLETFGNLENIIKTKNELAEYIAQENFVVYNKDNQHCLSLYEKRQGNKILTSISAKADIYASNLKVSSSGSTFTLNSGEENIKIKTKLIGEHNISNIVLAASLALKLGVSLEDIKEAINELEPVPHRLEVKEDNGVIIIDNSYNSSVDGTKASLKTLALFEGRKIVVTPGLIELGEIEKQENKEFGKRIAKVADVVIIVNQVHREAIESGLKEENFNEENIIKVNNLTEVIALFKTFLKEGDIILLENDLPDSYT